MKSSKQSNSFLRDKRILILGGAGSIGSALARYIARFKPQRLVILDQDETGLFEVYEDIKSVCNADFVIDSIKDYDALQQAFFSVSPHLVFHVAAYKHVVLMERYPEEAVKTNVEGTKNAINAAINTGVQKFIFISSDKAVYPVSVMGNTKLEGEEMCLNANGKTKFIVVRFGNVMPSQGSVIPIWNKQISENRPLTVTHPKMKRFFMGIYEAVNLILQAARLGKGGEIFILDMGKQIFIEDLAKMMIRISGKDLGIAYTKPGLGEKFKERLMTRDEGSRAKKTGNLYVIPSRR